MSPRGVLILRSGVRVIVAIAEVERLATKLPVAVTDRSGPPIWYACSGSLGEDVLIDLREVCGLVELDQRAIARSDAEAEHGS